MAKLEQVLSGSRINIIFRTFFVLVEMNYLKSYPFTTCVIKIKCFKPLALDNVCLFIFTHWPLDVGVVSMALENVNKEISSRD